MSDFFCAECVAAMPTNEFAIWFTLLLALSVVGFYGMFRYTTRARIIEDTPTSKIRSAAQGYVELIGFGTDKEQMITAGPLTSKMCLWYRYEVEEYRRSGKNSSWHTVDKGISTSIFQIDDGTGICAIDPEKAEVISSVKQVWHGSSRHPLTTNSGGLLSNMFGRRFRYTEERIHMGEQVYALGFLTTFNPGTMFNQKHAARDIVNEWKKQYHQLLERFDTNQDGEIDLDEWKRVQLAASLEAEDLHITEQAKDPVNVLAKPPSKRYPYLIATKDQKSLSKRYRWYSFGCLLVFFGVGSIVAWMANVRF